MADEDIMAVMEGCVMDFLEITALGYGEDSKQVARRYIKKAINYDVQQAIQLYYDEME